MVAAEIVKAQLNAGGRRELFTSRDRPGLEVDFLVPVAGELWMVEAKAGATVYPADARHIVALQASRGGRGKHTRGVVAYQPTGKGPATTALAEGVQALGLVQLVGAIRKALKR